MEGDVTMTGPWADVLERYRKVRQQPQSDQAQASVSLLELNQLGQDIVRASEYSDVLLSFMRKVRSGLYEDAPFLAIEEALAALPEHLRDA